MDFKLTPEEIEATGKTVQVPGLKVWSDEARAAALAARRAGGGGKKPEKHKPMSAVRLQMEAAELASKKPYSGGYRNYSSNLASALSHLAEREDTSIAHDAAARQHRQAAEHHNNFVKKNPGHSDAEFSRVRARGHEMSADRHERIATMLEDTKKKR